MRRGRKVPVSDKVATSEPAREDETPRASAGFSIDEGRLDKIENGGFEDVAVSRDVPQKKGVSDK